MLHISQLSLCESQVSRLLVLEYKSNVFTILINVLCLKRDSY